MCKQTTFVLKLAFHLGTLPEAYQRFTKELMSVSVEYVIDMKRIHTADEGQFIFPAISLCQQGGRKIMSSHLLIIFKGKPHVNR